MTKITRLKRKIAKKLLGNPIKCRHIELSLLSSVDDDPARPNDYLINLSLEAIKNAQKVDLDDICNKMTGTPYYPNIWPGEHYKLLAGFIIALKPKLVIEIGTDKGLSALTIKKFLLDDSKLVTFDIIPWNNFSDTCLSDSDFNNNFIQYVDDVSEYSTMLKYKHLFKSADFIFLDAAKDGKMEYKFLENLEKTGYKPNLILLLDDIRLWNMLAFWRKIKYPKLDLTSFGHWSGTGLIQLQKNNI
ncbi:MAG: O-methyltransferase [Candidatus Helarchaeota archaeon]